jgi:hypothetical protein
VSAAAPAVAAAARPQPPRPLVLYRDDGPLARALGAAGRALPVSPEVLTLAGALPLFAAVAVTGEGASELTAGVVLAVLVLLAGAAGGREATGRFRFLVPPVLRAAEYAGLLWLGALAGGSGVPAAFALLAAIAFRHYDLVYRVRHQGVTPPPWLDRLSGGWEGRLLVAYVLLLAGALPAGLFAAATVLGVVFVAESARSWAHRERAGRTGVYEDEEDEGQ